MAKTRSEHALTLIVGMSALVSACAGGCASSGSRMDAGMGTAPFGRVRADRMLRNERFDDAISAYLVLLEGPGDDPILAAAIHHHLSKAYWGRGGRIDGNDATDETRAEDRASAIEHARAALATLQSQPVASGGASIGPAGRSLGTYLRADEGTLDEVIALYLRLVETSADPTEDRVRTLYELGNTYLERSGRRAGQSSNGARSAEDFTASLRYLEEALSIARELENCPPVLLVSIANSLGLIHNVQLQPAVAAERFAEAEQLCRKHQIAASHAEVLQNLILVLIEMGQYDDARERCEQLEELPDAATNPRTMAALGLALWKLGHLSKARQQFDLARYFAREDPDCRGDLSFMAQLACNAAGVAQEVGAYDEAERYLRDAQDELESGGVDPRTAVVVQANLGRVYLTLERLDDAQVQLDAVLEVLTRLQGARHPDTLLLRLDLANLARARGHLAEAKEHCEDAVRGLVAAQGKDHPAVALARMELASLYQDQGRCPEAMEQANRARETLDAKLGPEHKQAVTVYLQTALMAADCTEDASRFEEMLREAGRRFAGLRDTLGPGNVEVLRAMVYFADVTAKTPAATATALRHYRKAEEGFLQLYSSGAKSLAALRLKQARLLERLERFDEALRTCDRAVRLMDRNLQQHPIHAGLLAAMGDIHHAQGNDDLATKRWQEALRLLISIYGPDHPRVLLFKEKRRAPPTATNPQ